MSRRWRLPARFAALGYLALLIVVPVGSVFFRAFQHGFGAAWDAVTTPEATHAFWLPRHDLRRRGGAPPGPAPLPGSVDPRRLHRHPARPLPGGRRAGPRARLRQERLVRKLAGRTRHRDHLLRPGHRDGLCHGGTPLCGAVGAPGTAGNRHGAGAGGPDTRCRTGSHLPSHHLALHTPIAGLWRHVCSASSAPWPLSLAPLWTRPRR